MVRPLTSKPASLGNVRRPAASGVAPAPRRPGAHAERELVAALLSGRFAPGSSLPPERELAAALGVTRPTLREALKKLDRDGFVSVRHGLPTRVNDVWSEGGLNVLAALAEHGEVPKGFVRQLLEVREVLAPAYAREAVRRAPARVAAYLGAADALGADPDSWTSYDWGLHRLLATSSGNPVYVLILNGFRELFGRMALLYFERPAARAASREFYGALRAAAEAGDPDAAGAAARDVMTRSVGLWRPIEARLARGGAR